jgi:uncharacterized protein YacL
MTKIIRIDQKTNRPIKKESEGADEGKTLFEHIGLVGGKTNSDLFSKFAKMLKSVAIMVIIGYLLGMIIDIMLETSVYAMIFAIVMLIIWILKVFGLNIPSKKKE